MPENFIFSYLEDISVGKKSMIFGQLASVAMFFAQFYAGTRKSLREYWHLFLEQVYVYLTYIYNT